MRNELGMMSYRLERMKYRFIVGVRHEVDFISWKMIFYMTFEK